MNGNQKIYWCGVATLATLGVGLGIWYPHGFSPNPINQPLVTQQTSRASGFTMRAEAKVQKNAKTGKSEVYARLFASGPMHNEEVMRMEGEFSLIFPNGKVTMSGPMSWTFSEDLKAFWPIESVPSGAKVKVTGFVHVYHREEIKSEREMMADGTVRLYMNTGTVSFRKIPLSKPAKLEIECLELGTVHLHGLELMAPDKKSVSNRILLLAGKQQIERETLPYLGRKIGMEPYIIRQLIPKRREPLTLVISVQNTGP